MEIQTHLIKKIMRKITQSLILILTLSFLYSSCSDESLDPLQVNKIQKGKLLALRGTALDNIYFEGIPAGEFFPRIATAADKFTFEAEYLSENPKSLESVDFFVIKQVGNTNTRVLLKNVPFSEFVNDGKYVNPWVTVTLPLSDVLTKIGLPSTFPMSSTTINELLSTYKFGINIEADLNLTDGSKALAENVVAAGLFQSDQFYPAQKLAYAVTEFCVYDANSWVGTYDATEIYSDVVKDPYTITISADPVVANRFIIDNFNNKGTGITAYFDISPSTSAGIYSETAKFPDQSVATLPSATNITKSSGSYFQCDNTISLNLTYGGKAWTYSLEKQ